MSEAIAQPIPAAPSIAQQDQLLTVIIVDASRSMADAFDDGSTATGRADAILSDELSKLTDNNPNAKAAVAFIRAGDAKACNTPVTIGEQVSIPSPHPRSPAPLGATNIGAALDAALEKTGGQPARIVIISDGGQSSDCGFHICTVAGERLPRSKGLTIDQRWASPHEGDAPPFPCVADALPNAAPLPVLPSTEDKPEVRTASDLKVLSDVGRQGSSADEGEITLLNSLPWALLAGLFASSFMMLGSSFSNAHRELDKRFQTINADAEKGNYVKPDELKPKTRLAAIVFAVAFGSALGMLWGPSELVGFARVGAGNALNTEFGAAVFLASLMTLGVFAGSQYWRYTELRRAYRVASNEAERIKEAKAIESDRQRKSRAEQDANRLAERYDSQRARFEDRDYQLGKYLERGELQSANAELVERVGSLLKQLAAGPALARENISSSEVERIARLNSFNVSKSPIGLIGSIPRSKLPEEIHRQAMAFFYPDKASNAEQQNESLKHLVKGLELLVTQQSSGT